MWCFPDTERSFADVELKTKIDAFLAERRNKNTVYDKPESEVVDMHKEDNSMDTV